MWPTPFGALHVNIPPRYIYPPKYGFFNKLWIFYWRCNSSILLYLIPIVLDESFRVEKIFLDAEAFPEWFEVFEDVVEPVARAEQRQQWRRVQILGNVKQNVWKMKHPKLLRDLPCSFCRCPPLPTLLGLTQLRATALFIKGHLIAACITRYEPWQGSV